jgi:hypothetical protein
MFHQTTGTEIRVENAHEMEQRLQNGYGLKALPMASDDPETIQRQEAEALKATIDALPEHERAIIVAEQKRLMRSSLHERLSALPEKVLEQVLAQYESAKAKKSA